MLREHIDIRPQSHLESPLPDRESRPHECLALPIRPAGRLGRA